MDRQTGCRHDGVYGEGEISGIGQFQEGVLQLCVDVTNDTKMAGRTILLHGYYGLVNINILLYIFTRWRIINAYLLIFIKYRSIRSLEKKWNCHTKSIIRVTTSIFLLLIIL